LSAIEERVEGIHGQVKGIHDQVKRIIGMDIGIRLIKNTEIRIRDELQIVWKKFNFVRRMAVTFNLVKYFILHLLFKKLRLHNFIF